MKNKGFTIIELLVMVGVLAVMSSILFIDFGKDNKKFALERSTQKLAQDIRRSQQMAKSALSGTVNTTGYGVYLSKAGGSNTQYIVYRNENVNPYYEAGTDIIVETTSLEAGISICDIKDNNVSESDNTMSISFEPPDPISYIEGNYFGHEAEITVCVASDASQLKKILINNSGRIEISN